MVKAVRLSPLPWRCVAKGLGQEHTQGPGTALHSRSITQGSSQQPGHQARSVHPVSPPCLVATQSLGWLHLCLNPNSPRANWESSAESLGVCALGFLICPVGLTAPVLPG